MQNHLRITSLVHDIVEGDEYLVSREWGNLKAGDFLFYGNNLLGVLDKIVDDIHTGKRAIYISCHYMSTQFQVCPEAQKNGLLKFERQLERQLERPNIQKANQCNYDLYAGII